VAPSAIASRFTGELPHELALLEIEELITFFALAAQRAQQAGFDGVEIAGNSGYLLAQFLSPVTNLRTDKYGGDLKGRMLFPLEVVTASRQAVGPGYPIMFRIGGNDFMPQGNTNAEAGEICAALEQAGVNAFNVTGGWHESAVPQTTMDVPYGGFRYLAKAIKAVVSVPVVACNRMTPQVAEEIVDSGSADFIGMARPLIADPDLPNKAAAGKYDEIRPCVACNQGCLDNVLFGKSLNCLTNAEVGRESELLSGALLPAEVKLAKPQKILVIGAGVAGLEYARVAASRGHQVTIWEETEVAGGQALTASIPPGRQEFRRLIDYLVHACQQANVQIVYGKQASAQAVLAAAQKSAYDRVVVATGSKPAFCGMPVEEGIAGMQAVDVLKNNACTGSKIVIIGGGALGIETALSLAEIGTIDAHTLRFLMLHKAESPEVIYRLLTRGSKEITVIDMQKGFAKDKGPTTRAMMRGMLKKYGVTFMDKTTALAVKQQGILFETDAGQQFLAADTVIFAEALQPVNDVHQELQGRIENLTLIGDADTPCGMQNAIQQAYDAARIC
jgi:2,4-dienoyl-CoA reductase (NADPH2)